jgi:hypothetical protein
MGKMVSASLVFSIFALVFAVPGQSDEPRKEPDKKIAQLMHRKLESSQKVLEGIVVNDFEKIARNAEELIEISKEAEWKVVKTETYDIYSNDFRRHAQTLVKNAKEKNVDAAALTYVELTLTCVRCHKHVRETRKTSFDEFVFCLAGNGSELPEAAKKPEPQRDDKNNLHLLMERKLEYSQKLLAAIAQNDQKTVVKNAEALVEITGEAQWKVFKTEQYDTYSGEFRRSAEQLAKYARDKNLDAAQLTYLELTLTCFNCHKYVRDQRH